MVEIGIGEFLNQHALPRKYSGAAMHWFIPLAERLAAMQRQQKRTLIVGINGAQGSGKSTLADLLVLLFKQQYQLNALAISIDDFYLTQQERRQLSKKVHPLLKTRGVPGTHDIALANLTINNLVQGQSTKIPRFDKLSDERFSESQWSYINNPVDIVVIEGWCLGVSDQDDNELIIPVNDLEHEKDPDALWRSYVNLRLRTDYAYFFDLVDSWVMLKAPSFSCVYAWRLEQERKLKAKTKRNKGMDEDAVLNFIMYFQRVSEHSLKTLPDRVNFLYELNTNRDITGFRYRE